MKSIYLGLDSNLGDREHNLVMARDLLMKHGVLVVAQSEVMDTEPLGGKDQPRYLNQVVEVQTELSPEELLLACKAVEREMGREVDMPSLGNVSFGSAPVAEEKPWESRIIDVDILIYRDIEMNSPRLTLPHPGVDREWNIAGLKDLGALS